MDRKLAQRAATAAHAGDLDTVRAAVAKDAAMARHWSLLMNACFGGQPDVVAFLIGEGAAARSQLFERIAVKTEMIRKVKEELRSLVNEEPAETPRAPGDDKTSA